MVDVCAIGYLKKEIEVVIPKISGEGEDVIKVVVEYEWHPSQCSTCKIFGHSDGNCEKKVVREEKPVHTHSVDKEGFQKPKKRHWRPKPKPSNPNSQHAESSKVNKGILDSETLMGVGTIKKVQVEQERVDTPKVVEIATVPPTKTNEGEFCTLDAGRTPGVKDMGEQPKTKEGPALVKSVIQTFKNQLKPRRGVVISDNRFSPLSSAEASDGDDMSIIDHDVGHLETNEHLDVVELEEAVPIVSQ